MRRRWSGCGCPTGRSPSTTWSAVRSRSPAEHVPDYVIVRANGEPLYTLVNPVDDALMGITHVLRGEDLLPSTPRQIVLYQRARPQIGVGSGRTPRSSATCPRVLGEGNRRLSKRDKGSGLAEYREQGYLPEALAQLPGPAGLGHRRRPRRLHPRRDGAGLRHPSGQRQPGPLRPQEVRGDQRRPHPAAADRRTRRPAGAVPGGRGTGQRSAAARRAGQAGRGHPAGPGADERPVGGVGAARLPLRRRRSPRDRGLGRAGRRRRARAGRRRGGLGFGARSSTRPRSSRRCAAR